MSGSVDHSLLGTVVRVSVATGRFRSAARLEARVLAEMRRLSGVLSRFDETSALTNFRQTGTTADAELISVLQLAQGWHEQTNGRFDPAPGHDVLPWAVADGRLKVVGDCSTIDLNALAKGWIMDRAADVAASAQSVVIDAGGDLIHRGTGSVRVGIEDPFHPFDNATPLRHIELSDAAIATSGPARRGPHLWDRDGRAPTSVQSTSVVAADAATADVVATAVAVGTPDEGIQLAGQLRLAVMIVDDNAAVTTNELWTNLEVDCR